MIERLFKLKKNNTSIRQELAAGVITFLAMSYILVVNPKILSSTGMSIEALYTTTALAAIVSTLLMAFLANLPVAQAPGMGLNSFFAYTVVQNIPGQEGHTWQFALTAVFISGVIFILLTYFNIRELILRSIPKTLKQAIPVGIGLFIAFIGLKNGQIVQSDPNTFLTLGSLSNHHVWIALLGIIVTVVLHARNIPGAILIGIIIATLFGVFLGDVALPEKNIISLPPSIEPIFAQFDWTHIFTFDMFVVVFTFLLVNLFDTVGTLFGIMSRIDHLFDQSEESPQIRKALFADAIGTTIGAVLGTSSVTSYVESSAGVQAGGRTGLTSVSTALMFLLALFVAPLFLMVPASAVAPALIIVGLFMISSVVKINFDDITEALPAFFTIIMMPFTYSIGQGVIFGILSFVIIKLLTGKAKSISITLYVLACMFILKFIFEGLE